MSPRHRVIGGGRTEGMGRSQSGDSVQGLYLFMSVAHRFIVVTAMVSMTVFASRSRDSGHLEACDSATEVGNLIPGTAAAILEQADHFELLSLNPDYQRIAADGDFHGYKVLRTVVIDNTETRKKLVSTFEQAVAENQGIEAACFNPRHGIRVTRKEKRADFVICFECNRVHVLGAVQGTFLITRSAEPLFDSVLRRKGVVSVKSLQVVEITAESSATQMQAETSVKISSGGLTPVRSADGKWGYIEQKQTYAIKPQFDDAKRFSEGLAPAALGKKFGYIDVTGRFVIEPQFVFAEPFSEGRALVFPDWGVNFFGQAEGYTLFVRAGYIDHTGKMVIKDRFVENAHSFSEGLAAFQPGINYTYGQSKWGYLDNSGNWAIQPQFDVAADFSEGLAAVCVHVQKGDRDKWGYIDKTGTLVIPVQFDKALPFASGLAKVKTSTGWRYLDKQGKFVGTDFLPAPGPVVLEGAKPVPH
jgi:WG containing repeat